MKIFRQFFSVACVLLLAAFVSPRASAFQILSPEVTVSITTVTSETKVGLQRIDLQNTSGLGVRGDSVAIEVEVTNSATAIGAGRTLTVYYAFATGPDRGDSAPYTATQISTATSNQVCSLVTTGNNVSVFSLPVVYQGGRYLYVYFDHTALDAASSLSIKLRFNGMTR